MSWWYGEKAPRVKWGNLRLGDYLLDKNGNVWHVTETTPERFCRRFGNFVIDRLKVISLTSTEWFTTHNAPASERIDKSWIWHSEYGCLLD